MACILVIDDEYETRLALRQMLERAGHEVVEASNGEEGMQFYRQCPTELVITDLFMPEKDGYEIIQEIRSSDPKVKIISMTSGEGDDCARARELGASRTFVKPFRQEELLDAIDEVL